MNKLPVILILTVLSYIHILAKETNLCLKNAFTQADLNICEEINLTNANKELNRVLKQIEKVYHNEKDFLNALKESQLLWIKLNEADLGMRFPIKNKPLYYGSVFPMCYKTIKTDLIIQRILYLKQWLIGIQEGDVCSGSIKRPYEIRKYK